MCGIGGIISKEDGIDLREAAETLAKRLRHRGPDGEGFLLINRNEGQAIPAYGSDTPSTVSETTMPHRPEIPVAEARQPFDLVLVHRLLRILDLSPQAHQPLNDPVSGNWIIHNGEVYNYRELRQELQAAGHRFYSDTDTEVILHAYREWGHRAWERFSGMWAFAIWDAAQKRLIACRDRTGVKPFYYYLHGETLAFASEIKALAKLSFIQTGVYEPAVFDLLVLNEFASGENTLFQNIRELLPGHQLVVEQGEIKPRVTRWWIPPLPAGWKKFRNEPARAYANQLQTLLQQAVSDRLVARVKVGTCLSGGLDSSAIACMVNQRMREEPLPQLGERQHLFTVRFADKSLDESPWAQQVAESIPSRWHTVEPTGEELLSDLETLHYCQDLPFASLSTYAQFRVMQLVAREGVRVAIDGQGGDELFAGYPHHRDLYLQQLFSRLHWIVWLSEASTPALQRQAKFWLRHRLLPLLPWRIQTLKQRYSDWAFIQPDLMHAYPERMEQLFDRMNRSLNRQLSAEYAGTYLKWLLKCEDRSSMWHSIESRTPFADDPALMDFAFSLPETYKIHRGTSKWILREAVEGIVPESVRSRKDKMGFVSPNNRWVSQLRPHLPPYFSDALKPWLQTGKLRSRADRFFHVDGIPENRRVFKLISFAVWHKVFFGK